MNRLWGYEDYINHLSHQNKIVRRWAFSALENHYSNRFTDEVCNLIPTLTQHFKLLFRNLIYTGLTRAKKLAVLVGTRKALAMAVKNQDTSQRQTYLKELLQLCPGLTIT